MKIKTSITISEELLKAIDQQSKKYKNRSEFIETALRAFITHIFQSEQNAKDLEIINRHAIELNQEAVDVLTYQVPP